MNERLRKLKGAIKNGQPKTQATLGTRYRTKINKKTQHTKLKR